MFTFKFDFYQNDHVDVTNSFADISYTSEVSSFNLDDVSADALKIPATSYKTSRCIIYYADSHSLENFLNQLPCDGGKLEPSILDAVRSHVDVKPGVVEGGFTIWDGSKDLVHFISGNLVDDFTNKNVLELGCGCGLPGIYAAKLGAKRIVFQDYNPDVLKFWTIPNVLQNLNITDNKDVYQIRPYTKFEFFSGDWINLSNYWQSNHYFYHHPKFDIILTCETIYRPDLYSRIHHILNSALSETGKIWLACKSNYGPGGNLADFMEYVSSKQLFQIKLHEISTSGVLRYIIELNRFV